MMVMFGELSDQSQSIDFAKIVEETVILYSTIPQSLLNHFMMTDVHIQEGLLTKTEFEETDYYFTITSDEFATFCSTDLHNMLVIDVFTFSLLLLI